MNTRHAQYIIILAVAVIVFMLGRGYQFQQDQKIVINFTDTTTYHKSSNTNSFNNSSVDYLLDQFKLDH